VSGGGTRTSHRSAGAGGVRLLIRIFARAGAVENESPWQKGESISPKGGGSGLGEGGSEGGSQGVWEALKGEEF